MSETLEYRGHTITVTNEEYVDDHFDPRNNDNIGTMVCGHRNYTLGDEQFSDMDFFAVDCSTCKGTGEHPEGLTETHAAYGERAASCPDCDGAGEVIDPIRWAKEVRGARVVLPLHLIDHSGISMNTSGFSCPWDSGQVGIIFDSPERLKACWGDPDDPRLTDERIIEILKGEVREYDDYLTGDIYHFNIEGPHCDESCGGFFPDHEATWNDRIKYIFDDAKAEVDASITWEQNEAAKIARVMAL